MLYIFGYIKESINEGSGLRSVIFFSGCDNRCKGCHNPESWNPFYGYPFTEKIQQQIIENIKTNPLLDGITLCGGEPFYSSKDVLRFVLKLRNEIPNINIWIYTGYLFEDIISDQDKFKLLKECDVLIDGKFIEEEKDLTLKFRGSRNQRIIDVQSSLKNKKVILNDL